MIVAAQGLAILDSTPCRAHLLERAGNTEAALSSHQSAADKTASTPERNDLLLEIARLRSSR